MKSKLWWGGATAFFFLQCISFFSESAQAYPEMVRHGYVNCNTCHVSLTGGGLLNDYGRELSRELMATWKSDDEKSQEHLFAYGALADAPVSKWLKMGADVREGYVYVNDAQEITGTTYFMQADYEAAAVFGRWTIDSTAGVKQDYPGDPVDFISRRHFVQYALSDEFNLRAGKYIPAYGIDTADHVTITRSALRLGYLYETYNLEASYITEKYNVFVTGIFGNPDDLSLNLDKGFAVQAAIAPTEKIKVGVNALYGVNPDEKRWLVGPFGLLGFTKYLMLQTEIDFQLLKPTTQTAAYDTNAGVATTQKLSYELTSGIWVYGIQEYGKIDFLNPLTEVETYGLGLQFFPRTHFEFNLAYEKAKQTGFQNGEFYDYAWFVTHFYL
jgi:hypothetical protein